MRSTVRQQVQAMLLCALLGACGGGGGGSGSEGGGAGTSYGSSSGSASSSSVQDAAVTSSYGSWNASVTVSQTRLEPGQAVEVRGDLSLGAGYITALNTAGAAVDRLVMLVTAERTFDATGWARQSADQNLSSILTPSGLAIEGGTVGAITNRFGYPFRTPVDELVELPVPAPAASGEATNISFSTRANLPADLPPGLYRIRVDFGYKAKWAYQDKTNGRWYGYSDLNRSTLGNRPFSPTIGSYVYSNILPASGKDVSGQNVDASAIQARIPWTLLHDYGSNGYSGVVADEDSQRFALSQKNLIHDEVILSPGGSYRLEPSFPVDAIDARGAIRWNWASGELSGAITGPDGVTTPLPTAPIVAKSSSSNPGPTTQNTAYTAWKPTRQGRYTVRVSGWIADVTGRRFEGGGTYHFWVGRRMTMATATFQGMAYPVGYKYGRDIAFFPAVPADVNITTTLYPNSSTNAAQTITQTSSGRASSFGIYGVAQGMKQMEFSTPGEYHAKIVATYLDEKSDLWICVMRHAGIVYPTANPSIVAHGKKILVGSQYVERGETRREGYVDGAGTKHFEHIAFPYNAGDMLLIANDETLALNKIEPVLTVEKVGAPATAWDKRLDGIGVSNIYMKTSNGLSPHMFPEYITDRNYYYGAAARPGFMGRFVVGDGDMMAPYWSTSVNGFGGQAGATPNGDLPGDLYRFFGGVVMREANQAPAYAGYLASGSILPKGSNNNRIVAAGSEDLIGSKGARARFFLAGFRPGTVLTEGTVWKPGFQIDPLLPVNLSLRLDQLDGAAWKNLGVAQGTGNAADGSWASPTAFTLTEPGVYRFALNGDWTDGSGTRYAGGMPGLPAEGGEFYVASAMRPSGAPGLSVNLSTLSSFKWTDKLVVTGKSSASSVRYVLLMPGAILGQGEIPVVNGSYSITLDPGTINKTTPIYDFISLLTGQPITYGGRILHLSLAAKESYNGVAFWDVKRVIARGTLVIAVK